jgi:hypothetical protein
MLTILAEGARLGPRCWMCAGIRTRADTRRSVLTSPPLEDRRGHRRAQPLTHRRLAIKQSFETVD